MATPTEAGALRTANLGFASIGADRELKFALEKFWRGAIDETALEQTAKDLRARHWRLQQTAGIDVIPSNDFSFYDPMLDMSLLVGALPERYRRLTALSSIQVMMVAARGGHGCEAMEMTKWFDTNYHYVVPELKHDQQFRLDKNTVLDAYLEAKSLGFETRPVIIGPLTFLLLAKVEKNQTISLLPRLLPVYETIISQLAEVGCTEVQIDEPILVTDLAPEAAAAFATAYTQLHNAAPKMRLALSTYFGDLRENLDVALSLPVASLHLDLVRGPEQLKAALAKIDGRMHLSCGLIDGRNIWRRDLAAAQHILKQACDALGAERVTLAPSCSLQYVPIDLEREQHIDAELRTWLAFGTQKLAEVKLLADVVNERVPADYVNASREALERRAASPRITRKNVQDRLKSAQTASASRAPYERRRSEQARALGLPLFPTTTIGSLPQTAEVRRERARFKRGESTPEQYQAFLEACTADAVRRQEEIGIDVLVHGEFERNDMVEYFGEQLEGALVTAHGWVRSYGSRCVKPPILFGDILREKPMTVAMSRYAQSLTNKPMKGMLTGPVTILQWSFVRDDQPRSYTALQLALAIGDEVVDLESAGLRVIQVDEPALREGLPLRKAEHAAYLAWAEHAFRTSVCGASDATQIHTHMCYAEFDDIIDSIIALDADVISLEMTRSQLSLLEAFRSRAYPNEIGPGVYDIHSPNVPTRAEVEALLTRSLEVFKPEQLWVNPDCGLKTRAWDEVVPSLTALVDAAKNLRRRYATAVAR
jgi:5-methyltetrahydropteroyltriglutamate--homocysteine methyltransferase